MKYLQLTLDLTSYVSNSKRKTKKIPLAIPPKPDPSKITLYRVRPDKDIEICDLIEQVASDILPMFPEMNGLVFGIRTGEMYSSIACWDFHRNQIAFTNADINWTPLEIGATLAHELTHAFHSKTKSIPGGEKATDLFMLTRLPLKYFQIKCAYLECNFDVFKKYPERVQALAKQALEKRDNGLIQYIRWFEDQINAIYYADIGEPMPKRTRFSWAAWKRNQKSSLEGEQNK